MEPTPIAPADMTPEIADKQARIFVNGMRRFQGPEGHPDNGKLIVASGQWSTHFKDHPWAIQSEREGWAAELRFHCIRVARRQFGLGLPCDVAGVMPNQRDIDTWSARAKIYREAAEWREKVIAEHGSVHAFLKKSKPSTAEKGRQVKTAGDIASKLDWTRTQRPGFDSEHRGKMAASGNDA